MRKKTGALILIVVSFFVVCVSYSEQMLADIEKSGIVRLHIIANSNSEKDQILKLAVRDELIKSGVFDGDVDLDRVNEICKRKISELGENYASQCCVGKFYFPTKSYKNIHLPAGNYRALKVVLGDGAGENWWCVMYPPMCFTENTMGEMTEENEEKLKKMMTEESFNLVSADSARLVPAFKVVELWQEIKNSIILKK